MLSETNSISEVESRLAGDYEAFEFTTYEAFTTAIIVALEDVQLLNMYPTIGSTWYSEIADKDKVDLTEQETYLYWAEVYYACVAFIERESSKRSSSESTNTRERLRVEGYEYETESGNSSSGDTASSYRPVIKEYYDKAVNFMCLAGYNPHQLKRGSTFFEDVESDDIPFIEVF